jgi:dUTP diphosphatase
MLKIKKLEPHAMLPTVTHPGQDLGFDLYALEDAILPPGSVVKLRTGIAGHFDPGHPNVSYGMIYRDRSSMAAKGIAVTGGVIDAGYRGELLVLLTNHNQESYSIKAGDKIVQMIPLPVLTQFGVQEVEELSESTRHDRGFGSSGR